MRLAFVTCFTEEIVKFRTSHALQQIFASVVHWKTGLSCCAKKSPQNPKESNLKTIEHSKDSKGFIDTKYMIQNYL